MLDDHGGGGVGGMNRTLKGGFRVPGEGSCPVCTGHEEFVVGEFLAVLLDGEPVFLKEGFVDGVAQLFGKGEGRLATGSGGDDEGEEVRVGGASVVHALDAGQATGKDSEGAGEGKRHVPVGHRMPDNLRVVGKEVEEDLVVEERGVVNRRSLRSVDTGMRG